MISFNEWQNSQLEAGFGKKVPEKKNDQGGFDPAPDQVKKFKKIDLITLPVEGTNCGNCLFMKSSAQKGVGFCTHKDVQEWVTSHMCCVFWDNSKVERKWKKGE